MFKDFFKGNLQNILVQFPRFALFLRTLPLHWDTLPQILGDHLFPFKISINHNKVS